MADAVVEAAADGSFDAGAGDAEALRREGNAAFQRKDFARARSLYSQALAARKDDHLALGNRSAAALALGDAEAALADATRAVKIAPTWAKGFWRKAAACEALGDVDGARESFERLAELVPKDSADGKRAVTKLAALTKSGKSTQRAVKKGFLASARGIYGRDDNQGSDDSTGWRGMLRRLKEGCNPRGVNNRGENVVLDDGVFGKLLVEREFQRLVYPGIPPEQLLHAPRNLQALLEDPWYEHELVALMPRVQSKAESVLTNVKKRGAAQGEVMDAATERMLIPQVLQEAFGREVLAMVHRVNYKKHVLLANDDRMLADPNADMATWDQLDDTFLDELLGHNSRGFAVLDEFMGEEWTELLLNDVRRMVKRKPLMPAVTSAEVRAGRSETPAGRLRFIELAECTSEFPALAELVEKLHALPFEINRKRPAHARLCAQFAHSTAFHALGTGEFQPLRLDCGVGDKDNGFKITCVYCFNGVSVVDEPEEESSTFVLRAGFDAEAHVERVKPRSDRLIAFQSRSVLNEITPVAAGAEDLYYLTFWIHGQELR